MENWFIYIVRCKDDSLYTGISTNVEKRISSHNAGKGAKYTRGRGPVKLEWKSPDFTKSKASRLESEIKQLPKKDKELVLELLKFHVPVLG